MFSSVASRRTTGFLPDVCNFSWVLGLLLTAQLLSLVILLAARGFGPDFWEQLGLLSLYIQMIALSACTLLCLLRPILIPLSNLWIALIAWTLILGITALVTWLAHSLLPFPGAGLPWENGLGNFMVRVLLISAILAALLLHYLYVYHLWRTQVEAEAEARFQSLQARIRPHFLFNSLNTIASLIPINPELAENLLQDLSDLLRAALSQEKLSTLEEELALTRHYLQIESQRLGARLQVEWDLDPELPLEAPLPQLSLQPLAENAVHHGISPTRKPGYLHICGRYEQKTVRFVLCNSLPEAENHASPGHGMGIENVRQRLETLYAGAARLTQERTATEFCVRLQFPYPWRGR